MTTMQCAGDGLAVSGLGYSRVLTPDVLIARRAHSIRVKSCMIRTRIVS